MTGRYRQGCLRLGMGDQLGWSLIVSRHVGKGLACPHECCMNRYAGLARKPRQILVGGGGQVFAGV